MNGMLEYKQSHGLVKDIDSKNRIITGYLSSFGNIDKDGDVIVKGAFDKSIMERKDQIYFLNQHNWKEPHGQFTELKEDDKGLYFESTPLAETSYSNDVIKLYEAGVMKNHSIGFITVNFERKNHGRKLKELKLFEGSNVTIGSNSDTPFLGFKSTLKEINDQSKTIYNAIRNGDFTDKTFVLLEIGFKTASIRSV